MEFLEVQCKRKRRDVSNQPSISGWVGMWGGPVGKEGKKVGPDRNQKSERSPPRKSDGFGTIRHKVNLRSLKKKGGLRKSRGEGRVGSNIFMKEKAHTICQTL